MEFIYEVEVQDEDLPNVLEEKSMLALESNKKIDQPTPLYFTLPLFHSVKISHLEPNPSLIAQFCTIVEGDCTNFAPSPLMSAKITRESYEPLLLNKKEKIETLEIIGEWIAYVNEAMERISMQLEKQPITLKDKEPKEMSIIEIPLEKHYDRTIQDAPYIEEIVEHENILPLVINDNPPLEKLSEPLKPILEPLSSMLEYASLRDIEVVIPYEDINLVICKLNIYYEKDDPRDLYS